MGAGYYLGDSRRGGWKISKTSLPHKDKLAIAIAEGRFFCDKTTNEKLVLESNNITQINDLTLVDYSEKAVALFGDTKPLKDTLKQHGGRFNPRLINPVTKSKQAGWVFKISHKDTLQKMLNLI